MYSASRACDSDCGLEGDPLYVVALQKQPQLQHKKLFKGQTSPGTLCFVLRVWLMPAFDGLKFRFYYLNK